MVPPHFHPALARRRALTLAGPASVVSQRGTTMPSGTKWPEEHTAVFKRLYAEGLSGSQIAHLMNRELGTDYTRNAIIGKAHRMGFARRSSKPRPRSQKWKADAPKTRKLKPFVRYRELPRQRPFPLPPEPVFMPLDYHLTLMQLTERTCKFPVGDPRDADFGFCGAPKAMDGGPYCSWHRQIAYQSKS